jgi:thiamine phosphate synthase YjbQ (UPF0047 family)
LRSLSRTGEDNADAYLKRQVMGREVVVAVTHGKLDFGPWEQIPIRSADASEKTDCLFRFQRSTRLTRHPQSGMARLNALN